MCKHFLLPLIGHNSSFRPILLAGDSSVNDLTSFATDALVNGGNC